MEILKKVFSIPVKILATLVAVILEGVICSALIAEITDSSKGLVLWKNVFTKPTFGYAIIILFVLGAFHLCAYYAGKAIKTHEENAQKAELEDDALAAFAKKQGYDVIADEIIKAAAEGDTSKVHNLIDLNNILKDGRKK
ncbi:hypothetical protein [Clostridium sp. DJ247]|uniref:hypothetical protein n=1 Tax=Clostridium sp. DJ247 TaxID=2726188 RepID=UPI0016264DF0|nr:hypothetical protein [Clostridium sp. DJ247]MBC2580149.1 hypothetical protein [Clostridium sp. DJ247]